MKLSKSKIQRIIKEEISRVLEALDPNVHSGRPQSTEIYPVDQQQDFEDELWNDEHRREEAWQQQQQETGEVPPGAWSGDSDEDDEYDDDDYEELPKNRSMRNCSRRRELTRPNGN